MKNAKLPPNMLLRQYVTKRGVPRKRYYCRYTINGERRIEALGSDVEQAKARYHAIMAAVERGEDPHAEKQRRKAANFRRWAEEWLTLTRHKRSHDKDAGMVARLIAFFGEVALPVITADRIEAYKAQRRAQQTRYKRPPSPALINRELGALRSILFLAKQSGLITDKPVVRFYRENNQRDRTLTVDEYRQVLDVVKPRYRPAVVLLWELGARENEAVGLRWSCVDFQRQAVTFDLTKTEPRTVPMSPVVEELLRTLTPRLEDDRVFDFSVHTFKCHMRACFKKIGLSGVWVHDFRRTFVTRKQREGWDYKRIMMITGHKDLRIFDRYNKPSFDDLRSVLRDGNPSVTQSLLLGQSK